MASISISQNRPENLRRLKAARLLYARAKRVTALQAVLACAAPIAAAAAISWWPDARAWVALFALLIPVLDNLWLDPRQRSLRVSAASVQEEFDCNVLELPWNQMLVSRPDPEAVHAASRKYQPSTKAPVEDWYPTSVDALSGHRARVLCQRTNCWWDSQLRRRYGVGLRALLALVIVLAVALGMWAESSVESLVLAVAPLSPTLLWGIREVQRHEAAAAALDRLKALAGSLWEEVLTDQADSQALARSRTLQDAILLHRQQSPPVFDWIYRLLRRSQEEDTNATAQQLVQEALSLGES